MVLADEPISMLDVSIRIGILNLIAELKRRRASIAFLYITHDIASARYVADEMLVMVRRAGSSSRARPTRCSTGRCTSTRGCSSPPSPIQPPACTRTRGPVAADIERFRDDGAPSALVEELPGHWVRRPTSSHPTPDREREAQRMTIARPTPARPGASA